MHGDIQYGIYRFLHLNSHTCMHTQTHIYIIGGGNRGEGGRGALAPPIFILEEPGPFSNSITCLEIVFQAI